MSTYYILVTVLSCTCYISQVWTLTKIQWRSVYYYPMLQMTKLRPGEAEWLVWYPTANIWWILDLSPEFILFTTINTPSAPERPSLHLECLRGIQDQGPHSLLCLLFFLLERSHPALASVLNCFHRPRNAQWHRPGTAWTSPQGAESGELEQEQWAWWWWCYGEISPLFCPRSRTSGQLNSSHRPFSLSLSIMQPET